MNKQRCLTIVVFFLFTNWAAAQPGGESDEPSPEALDAAYTAEDAAREAAAWSDVVIDRSSSAPLVTMADRVDLVFRGAVKSQAVVYDDNDLPFTHTTFSMLEVLKGAYLSDEIVIIQEGGPSRSDKDSLIIVSSTRHFSVGEEELLFVDLAPEHTQPMRQVNVEHRFRIYEGKVYDDNGRGLILTGESEGGGHRLEWSRDRNPAQKFSQIQIGSHTLTKGFSEDMELPDSGGESPQKRQRVAPSYQSSVDVDSFSTAITQ